MNKIYAILGGGDWYDASVDHIILPEGVKIDEAKAQYSEWLRNKFRNPGERYRSFPGWLCEFVGARRPTSDELEEFEG